MKIALSTDHAGFEQLQHLQEFLQREGHECVNFGPEQYSPEDDYPDYIFPAAKAVANGECEVGIIFGGSGVGEAIAANRVHNVRCGVYYGPATPVGVIDASGNTAQDEYEILRLNKQHNNGNMLSMAGRFLTIEQVEIAAHIWLNTPFSNEERHVRRNNKLDE